MPPMDSDNEDKLDKIFNAMDPSSMSTDDSLNEDQLRCETR